MPAMLHSGGTRRPSQRRLLWLALAASLALAAAVGRAETPLQREDRIKAALVFKLIKFVEWPASALAGRDPLQICALGESPVGQALALADGKPVRDRVAQFRRVEGLSPSEVKACHVLFVPGSAREIATGVPTSLRGRSMLTVSDATDFARRGGMVGLIRGENKVTFEINLRNAREGGLNPEATLLELSSIVE